MNGKRILKGNYISHFFITVVQTEDDVSGRANVKIKHSRCWGYTDTFEKAEEAVLKNYTDFHENNYQWIIIEEHIMDPLALTTGLYKWFHWNKDKQAYKQCRQPKWAKRVCNWGIG